MPKSFACLQLTGYNAAIKKREKERYCGDFTNLCLHPHYIGPRIFILFVLIWFYYYLIWLYKNDKQTSGLVKRITFDFLFYFLTRNLKHAQQLVFNFLVLIMIRILDQSRYHMGYPFWHNNLIDRILSGFKLIFFTLVYIIQACICSSNTHFGPNKAKCHVGYKGVFSFQLPK